jgi:hypothetical protein
LDIFLRSAISVFRDFFILSVSGSSHTFSVAVWLYACRVCIVSLSSHMIPA